MLIFFESPRKNVWVVYVYTALTLPNVASRIK
jgi:hypothetical protein